VAFRILGSRGRGGLDWRKFSAGRGDTAGYLSFGDLDENFFRGLGKDKINPRATLGPSCLPGWGRTRGRVIIVPPEVFTVRRL